MVMVYIREQRVKNISDDGWRIVPTCKESVIAATETPTTENGIAEKKAIDHVT